MTATEAEVVQTILQGLSLRDYSDRHKMSYETARTHLKNTMRKNGWGRQGEMISEVVVSLSSSESFKSNEMQNLGACQRESAGGFRLGPCSQRLIRGNLSAAKGPKNRRIFWRCLPAHSRRSTRTP